MVVATTEKTSILEIWNKENQNDKRKTGRI